MNIKVKCANEHTIITNVPENLEVVAIACPQCYLIGVYRITEVKT